MFARACYINTKSIYLKRLVSLSCTLQLPVYAQSAFRVPSLLPAFCSLHWTVFLHPWTTSANAESAATLTVPITHKSLEKRVHTFAGRVYTASTLFHGGTWLVESVLPTKLSWGWGGVVNQTYIRLSTTHGHITDCKLDSVVYAGVCVVI